MQFFTTAIALSLATFVAAAPAVQSRQSGPAIIRFIKGGQIETERVTPGTTIDTTIQADLAQLRTDGVTCELSIDQSSESIDLKNRNPVDLSDVRVVSSISCDAA